jgi:hypothetical protein
MEIPFFIYASLIMLTFSGMQLENKKHCMYYGYITVYSLKSCICYKYMNV